MDIFSRKQRSAIMSRVKNSGTDIEKNLLSAVRPFWPKERYRKNAKNLPGKPDILFPRKKIVIFADGDFWHGHNFDEWSGKIPKFWKEKIASNIARDKRQVRVLKKQGYRVVRFWGSMIKKHPDRISDRISKILR